jgi:hypothetical protein
MVPPPAMVSSRLLPADLFLSSLLDGIPTAVAIIDSAGVVAHCNAAWRELGSRTAPFGELGSLVAPGDRDGASYVHRLAGMDGPLAMPAHQLARAIQDALSGRPAERRIAYRMRRPEADDPFEAVVRPLTRGAIQFALVAHLEQREHEQASDATQAALRLGLEAEELRASGDRLDRRLAALGQTLNGPITVVRLELHLLSMGALGPITAEQAKALALVLRSVERWMATEQAVLREPHEPPAAAALLDISALARQAAESRQTQALKAGIQLVLRASGEAVPVVAPMADVAEVLDLFIGRALQASPSGSVVAVEVSRGLGEAVVEVRDSGPGLSARDARLQFEPWLGHRLDGDAPPLALHHARLRIELAGGRVWAESDGSGQGATLAMAFPLG